MELRQTGWLGGLWRQIQIAGVPEGMFSIDQ
jgi:hypothetical protein